MLIMYISMVLIFLVVMVDLRFWKFIMGICVGVWGGDIVLDGMIKSNGMDV